MDIRIPKEVVCKELEGEAVLLNLSTGLYFGLDVVGTRVWALLAEHGSTEKALASLLEEYDVEESRLRGDVERLVGEMAAKGLVKADG